MRKRPDQRLADAEDELHGLGGLDRADEPGQDAEHARLGAARDEPGRRRLRIQAAVAGAVLGREHRRLPLEAEDAAVDVRLAEQHAGVVDEVARREVVGAVDDDVVAAEQIERVGRGERISCAITLTCGFSSFSVSFAESSFGGPTSEVPCRIWRCRLLTSTTSKSTMPIVPTPAAARYIATGEPRPPAPMHSTLAALSLRCPSIPTSGRIR